MVIAQRRAFGCSYTVTQDGPTTFFLRADGTAISGPIENADKAIEALKSYVGETL